MALTQERIGQIAMAALKQKMGEEGGGLRLNPKTVKRQVSNEAKSLGVSPGEAAEFVMILIKEAYEDTMKELQSMIDK